MCLDPGKARGGGPADPNSDRASTGPAGDVPEGWGWAGPPEPSQLGRQRHLPGTMGLLAPAFRASTALAPPVGSTA